MTLLMPCQKKQRTELARGAAVFGIGDFSETVRDACAMIRHGDALDAARFLEAEFFPKWQTVDDCAAALKKEKD